MSLLQVTKVCQRILTNNSFNMDYYIIPITHMYVRNKDSMYFFDFLSTTLFLYFQLVD